jgi:hypothetical protein
MKTTISLYDFRDAFQRMGRGNQFSYDGLEILFDYFEQIEEDMGEEIDFDVIAICCEYVEEDPKDTAKSYDLDINGLDDDEISEKVRDFLEDEGAYIGATDLGMIIYRQF